MRIPLAEYNFDFRLYWTLRRGNVGTMTDQQMLEALFEVYPGEAFKRRASKWKSAQIYAMYMRIKNTPKETKKR